MRGIALAVMTVFATNMAQYAWNAAQAAALAGWWALYAKGAGEKETALRDEIIRAK